MAIVPDVEIKPQDVHRYLQQFGWDLEKRRGKYPTKYVYNPDSKEQFKLIVKEYCRMEEEKDQRQYGSLLDALARMEVGSRIEPRWAETMKPVATVLESGEYAAIAGSAILWNATRSPELKNGYLGQVMDEVRHTVQTGYINYGKAHLRSSRSCRRQAHPLYEPTVEDGQAGRD